MRNNNNIVGDAISSSKTSSVLPSNRFPTFIASSKEQSLVKKYSSISISSQSKPIITNKQPHNHHINTNSIISTIHHDIQSLQNQTASNNSKLPFHQSHNSIHNNNNNSGLNAHHHKHKKRQHNRNNKPQLFYSTKTLHSTHSKCFSSDINEYHAYHTIHTMNNDNTYTNEQTLTKPNIIYEKIHLKTPQFPMKSKAVNNGITNTNTSVNTDIHVQQNGKELIGKGSISNIKININEKFRRSLEKNRKLMDVNEDNKDDDDNDIKRNRSVPDGKGNGKENEVKCLKEVINRMQKVIYMKDNEIEKLKGIINKKGCGKCNCSNSSVNAVKSKIEAIINKYNNNNNADRDNERINSLLHEIKCAIKEID